MLSNDEVVAPSAIILQLRVLLIIVLELRSPAHRSVTIFLLVAMEQYDRSRIDPVARTVHASRFFSFDDVARGGERGVHEAKPAPICGGSDGRKSKLQWLPICINRDVTHLGASEIMQRQREAM